MRKFPVVPTKFHNVQFDMNVIPKSLRYDALIFKR